MATKEKKNFKKKLFQVVRELNVSEERVIAFLDEEGYSDALSGSGLNAKITDEEAYLVLREEYADDAEAAARVRELRQQQEGGGDGVSRDEVSTLDEAQDAEPDAVDASDADAPDADASDAEMAEAEAPEADVPEADVSETDAPEAGAPEADAPEAETPEASADTATDAAAEADADAVADADQAQAEDATEDATAETDATAAETPAAEAPAAEEPVAEESTADAAVSDDSVSEDDAVSEAAVSEAATADESGADAPEATASDAHGPEVEDSDAEAVEADAAEPVDTADAEAEAVADETVADEAVSDEAVADASASEEPVAESTDAAQAEAQADAGDAEATETKAAEADAAQAKTAEADAAKAETADAKAADAQAADAESAEADDASDEDAEEDADEGQNFAVTIDEDRPEDIDTDDVEDVIENDDDEEPETLKANRYRLSGTQVVGKVDLDQLRRPKRKRKRKKKEEDDDDSSKDRQDRKSRKKKKQKSKKRRKQRGVDEEDVEQTIQETLQELEQGASRARQRRRRRRRERHERERQRRRERQAEREDILEVTEFVTTGELANLMGEPVKEVISTLFDAGMMVSINQRLDRETIEFVAAEYDLEVEFIDEFSDSVIELKEDDPEDLQPRSPVVTVMGHVDHGKTSLLDYIRSANVVAGEEGGITQHIGAHRVLIDEDQQQSITFLDTPGHEAFTAMRARGAKATDIVILVVAADDSVMPQTIEAINHAQAADVPIVVAINKMDLPEADPDKVKGELAEHNVLVEEYGGTIQVAEVSAETGEGVDDLLEKVALQAEIMELQANPNREASGVIIESRLEKGRGNVITVLVQNGTLEVGDPFLAGIYSGSVRAMFDERDSRIEKAGPAQPALVLGCDGSPEVGDQFVVLGDEGVARDIASERQRIHREQELRRKSQVSLDQVSRRMAEGEFHELNLIVKGDVGGSVEALSDSLLKLKTDEVAVNIVHSGVGAINESDVMLARASDAVIIGFQVRPTPGARESAEREEVDIRTYSIIYDAIEDVHDALEGLLSPERREETKGHAEVRDIFKVPNVGTIAGSYVTDGKISRNHQIRVVREGVVTYEGRIGSLKRFQEDVKEVQSGYECGISIQNFNDIKVGDELETYVVVEEKRTLEV